MSSKPPLPRQQKRVGHAQAQAGGAWMVYTEQDMEAYGEACYAAGLAEGLRRRKGVGRAAAPAARAEPPHDAIQAEETAWADYRAGRGPRPVRG